MSASPRRIALITSQAFSIVNFRRELIQTWLEAGHQVFALAPDYDPRTEQGVRALGATPVAYRLSRAGRNPLADLAGLLDLCRQLRRLRPDLTLSYFMKPVIYGTLAARLVGCPRRFAMVEGTGYVFSDEGRGLKHRLLRGLTQKLLRLALHGARRVYFLNREDESLFLALGLASAGQASLLGPIGLDLAHYTRQPPPAGPLTFLLAARMLRAKGVADYVAAARMLRARHPEVRFLLLGGPDVNPASHRREELQAWHDEGIVTWQDHVEDVRPWLARSSVFVLPSYYREGVPRTIQEAMATGRPVITTDMPGCRDAVADGVNGYLVPPRDPAALCAAMARFVEQPELVASLGEAARQHAEAAFDGRRLSRRMSADMALLEHAHV